MDQYDLTYLSHGGEHHAEHHKQTPAERAEFELKVFHMLMYSHLSTFLAILVMLYAKSKKKYNFA